MSSELCQSRKTLVTSFTGISAFHENHLTYSRNKLSAIYQPLTCILEKIAQFFSNF